MQEKEISWDDFSKIEMRTGTILKAEFFDKAKKPAIKLVIDFGMRGQLKSSAQITDIYNPDHLIGKQIIAVVNLPPKQISNFISECLVLGVINDQGQVILLSTDHHVINGLRIS